MSNNDKNPRGFWFYGPKKEDCVTESMITDFLCRRFNVLNTKGWLLYYDPRSIYFVQPHSSYLEWTSDGYPDFKTVQESLPHYDIIEGITIEMRLEEENTYDLAVLISPGVTKCDETCIFYQFCDGERDSIFNPSYNSKTFPCTKYKLNSYDIKKTK